MVSQLGDHDAAGRVAQEHDGSFGPVDRLTHVRDIAHQVAQRRGIDPGAGRSTHSTPRP
jgi:hypothetical protein